MSPGRDDQRGPAELRPASLVRRYLDYPEGSCLIRLGRTMVLCTATVEEDVPPFLRGKGTGWVTAEYAMLPRSTQTRTPREQSRGRGAGRSQEIQRLIGRSLRAGMDLKALGERTLWMDCDVLQADGGTRTAAITGSVVALYEALRGLVDRGKLARVPLREFMAAVSVGIVGEFPLLDLSYEEDSRAAVDMNLVLTESGKIVEVQGTAETAPFSRSDLETLLELGQKGVASLIHLQKECLGIL